MESAAHSVAIVAHTVASVAHSVASVAQGAHHRTHWHNVHIVQYSNSNNKDTVV